MQPAFIGGDPRLMGSRKTREEIKQELFMRKRSRKNNRKSSTMVIKHRNEDDEDGTNLIEEIGMFEEQFPDDDSGDDNEDIPCCKSRDFQVQEM